jgi:hypothetical protein
MEEICSRKNPRKEKQAIHIRYKEERAGGEATLLARSTSYTSFFIFNGLVQP